jgi:hypothetical protein
MDEEEPWPCESTSRPHSNACRIVTTSADDAKAHGDGTHAKDGVGAREENPRIGPGRPCAPPLVELAGGPGHSRAPRLLHSPEDLAFTIVQATAAAASGFHLAATVSRLTSSLPASRLRCRSTPISSSTAGIARGPCPPRLWQDYSPVVVPAAPDACCR